MALSLKLGAMLIKTLTKPIANELKFRSSSPGFLRSVCERYGESAASHVCFLRWLSGSHPINALVSFYRTSAGQLHNNVMARIQLRSMGHHVKTIKALPEDEVNNTLFLRHLLRFD